MSEIKQPSRRIKSSYVVALLLAVAVTAWIGSGIVTGNEPDMQAAAGKEKPEHALPTVRVMQSIAQTQEREVILFGRTEAVNQADIAAEIAGRIVKKAVNKGDFVEQGDVLFRLSMDDRQSQLEEAKAKLEYQTIAYNAAKKLEQKQFQSQVKLAQEKAALETARTALKVIELEIAKTVVQAPIRGVINTLSLSVGDYVKSGDVVATIVDLDPIRIVSQVSERDVSRIRPNGKAVAILPAGRRLEGVVKYISRVGSSATRTFDVDVWVENSDSTVPEGLTAELHLPAENERAHLVSSAILTLDDEGAIGVKGVNDQGIVTFYRVSIVSDTPEGIWLGGLPEVVTLITVGQEFVRSGQKVLTATEADIKSGIDTSVLTGSRKADPS